MEALYDQSGKVYAWVDTDNDHILNLHGQHVAFIMGNSVYNWRGKHIGWWHGDHIRDRSGAVSVFTAEASSLGVVKPVKGVRPVKPVKFVAPVRPVLAMKPVRPVKRLAWSSDMPF